MANLKSAQPPTFDGASSEGHALFSTWVRFGANRVAREQGLGRLEVFQLIDRQGAWHRVLVMEFPTFEAAEIFIDAEVKPRHGLYSEKSFYLARKWCPEYFASWISPTSSGCTG